MAERITIFRETTADFSTAEAFYASVVYFQAITADCIVMSAKAKRKDCRSGASFTRKWRVNPKGNADRTFLSAPRDWDPNAAGGRQIHGLAGMFLPAPFLVGKFLWNYWICQDEDGDAPSHLRERLDQYTKKHRQLIVMCRAAIVL